MAQIGFFKLALLAVVVAIGAHWHESFTDNMTAVLVVVIAAIVYIIGISSAQK